MRAQPRPVLVAEHAQTIAGLWQRNLNHADAGSADAKVRLGYIENPAGSGQGILLDDEQGVAVGVICIHPRQLHWNGSRLEATSLADFAVERSHRSFGPALMLMRQALSLAERDYRLLYALPNRNSAAICQRAGLPRIGMTDRFARVLSTSHPTFRQGPAWRQWIAPLAVGALRVAEAWRRFALKPRLRCDDASFDSAELDQVWARRPADLVLGDRSSAFLRWRFGRAERGDWRMTLLRGIDQQACGWIVWRMVNRIAEIGDLFSVDPARLTAPAILAFLPRARQAGAAGVSIEFFGQPDVVRALRHAGLRARGPSSPVVARAAPPLAHLLEARCWYLTAFDNDAD